MSLHFSANQYERNFKPTLLQNWEVPRRYREKMIERGMRDARPRAFVGFTQIVASDKGHLLPGVKRSRESPWGTFVGTWDLPLKIPGNSMLNCTARTEDATLRLRRLKTDGDIVLEGKLKQCNIPSPLPVKADKDADKTLTPKAAYAAFSGSGARTGAVNPMADLPLSPGIVKSPVEPLNAKPATPNIDWPKPGSQGSRAKSASPKVTQQKSPLPAISPAKPGTPAEVPIRWPSPQPEEPCGV